MAKEDIYSCLVLKKQAFGEADELITIFSREAGKLRVLARGVKKPTSKLQYSLQLFTLAKVRTAARGQLPVICGAEVVSVFPKIREDVNKSVILFWIAELYLKTSPDGQVNIPLFDFIVHFLQCLEEQSGNSKAISLFRVKFLAEFLRLQGYEIARPSNSIAEVWFSNQQGGFVSGPPGVKVDQRIFENFAAILKCDWKNLGRVNMEETGQIEALLFDFVNYQIERTVKSQAFLDNVV